MKKIKKCLKKISKVFRITYYSILTFIKNDITNNK